MNLIFLFFIAFVSINSALSQKSISIENDDFKVSLVENIFEKQLSSVVDNGTLKKYQNTKIDQIFKTFIPFTDQMVFDSIPAAKYSGFVALNSNNLEIKYNLIRQLCSELKLKLQIENIKGNSYQVKVKNIDLLVEKAPEHLNDMDSFLSGNQLEIFGTMKDLAERLQKITYFAYAYNGFMDDKYYFKVDLENIDESLAKFGIRRTSKPIEIKVYKFSLI